MSIGVSHSLIDASDLRRAAEILGSLIIGAAPSRTNPSGGRRRVLSPREAIAREAEAVVTFCIESIRELTPAGTGRVRESYNVRSRFGGGASKADFSFAEWRIESDLDDAEQVVVATLEYGSRPHVIRGRDGGYMRIELAEEEVALGPVEGAEDGEAAFIVEEAGVTVLYARRVFHPGTQPHAMFRTTLSRCQVPARAAADRAVAAWAATARVAGRSP